MTERRSAWPGGVGLEPEAVGEMEGKAYEVAEARGEAEAGGGEAGGAGASFSAVRLSMLDSWGGASEGNGESRSRLVRGESLRRCVGYAESSIGS